MPPFVVSPFATGWPGIPPRWTSSAKDGVGTALTSDSRVWFTLSHGILNEVYYPRVDSACTRDMGFIVTDGVSYFSEEKRHATSTVRLLAPGVPAFHVRSVAFDGRYQIDKDILSDPSSDVVLQRVQFTALKGSLRDYRLFALLAPHLANHGSDNTAWLDDYKGTPLMYAERDGHALALVSSVPWIVRSVGFVGVSDGWQQLIEHRRIAEAFARAANGNVAIVGEVALTTEPFVLALGFGTSAAEAGQRGVNSLITGFDEAASAYVASWQQWHAKRRATPIADEQARSLVDFSAAVLRVHESRSFPGGVIASLSVPWGFNKGDDDLGGYHLVWPRDLVETAGGFLAFGANGDARRVLRFLRVTQDADGHWCQNMWLDGSPYWTGIQMDEAALPILLVDLAARRGALTPEEAREYWPMMRKAASFIARNGPVSPQDRWEEDPGYSPFTLAAEIAALIVTADAAQTNDDPVAARYLRDTADAWYASLDDWLYVAGTDLARRCGIDGYYVRIAAPDAAEAASPKDGFVPIKNRPPSEASTRAALMVSPDALALVRFGLRAANDVRITNTVKAIDALLKVDTPSGEVWRRYNGDGYGEHEDGSAFDGTGIGRPWPLLTGERGHYEVAAGNTERAVELARAMQAFAGQGQLLPEQVWDADDIPALELFKGGSTGSARPLVWAHAEYIKLRRSIEDGAVFDCPPQTVARYITSAPPVPAFDVWRFNNKIRTMARGKTLRIVTLAPARVHVGADGWLRTQDIDAVDTHVGVWVAEVDPAALGAAERIGFTFYWPEVDRWEGEDFEILYS